MVFPLERNMAVRTHFMVIDGFIMEVGGLFIGDNLADRVQEKAGMGFHQVWFEKVAWGNRIW